MQQRAASGILIFYLENFTKCGKMLNNYYNKTLKTIKKVKVK